MADYECFPLWKRGENGTINLDPDNLALSAETKRRLRNWAEWYDSTLNPDDPASSGFVNKADEQAFEEEGDSLSKTLLKELKGTCNIVYFSESLSERTEFQRESTDAERRGEAPGLPGNSVRKRETDTISSNLQRMALVPFYGINYFLTLSDVRYNLLRKNNRREIDGYHDNSLPELSGE